ncbi:glycoside hydrolase family 61 protein [Gelatoporia subvermispora B]|uniref:AA9 family lytic polysaccharide monooxygenase n=1 Tax=Ceriporiopsis subvermispora (strain B) TaxID=914234 RepID=M2QYQ9_CERS8|nr:glycoside hydrolase family 61 protein [Gelatoporia subvermispora B]
MFAFASLLALASAALPTALAHGGVLSYEIAGQWYEGWAPYNSPDGQTSIERPWSTYNPITDPTDPTLSCNDDGTSSALQLTATVQAGTPITAYWNSPWPHNIGPMLVYLAQCPGTTCTGVNSDTLQWFKIDESGLINGTVGDGFWGDGLMIAQNSSWTTTIPTTVPSGPYLIRFETIALHSLPAQFYPECAQLDITGGGSLAPTTAELVTFPGAYSASDPGLTIDVYTNQAMVMTNYTIPGPPLYGSSQSSQPAPPPVTSAPATGAPLPTTSAAPPATSSAAVGTVAQYGQCGGEGYSGPTSCEAGLTCTALNDYYSQCL